MNKEISQQEENQLISQYFQRIRDELLFPLYAWLNLKIKDKSGMVQRFLFNKLQRKLWSVVKEQMQSGKPIRLYFIKSRQTGSTTFWLALIFFLTTLWKNRNAIIIAHDDEASESLGEKFQNYLHRSNKLLVPSVRKTNRKEVWFATSLENFRKTGDIGLDNHIDNSTANRSNLGRSYTYHYAILSEFGLWEESGVDIKATLNALFNSIPRIAGSMIVIETTAKGEGFAKDFWEDEYNGFTKIFISWIADDTYRSDIPVGIYFDLSDTEDTRYGNEFAAMEIIRNELLYWDVDKKLDTEQKLYHETMCRLAWRRIIIDENCMGDKEKFRQEYPLTPQDAFSTSSKTVFPIDRIERQLKANKEQEIKPVCYTTPRINPDQVDYKQFFQRTNYGKLKVFEPPQSKSIYVIGGDGAQGIKGGDFSSLVVLKLPELYEVASYQEIIRPTDFATTAYNLSRMYNNALLGIEINDKGGFATIESIRENYPHCNLYGKVTLRNDGAEKKFGFSTTAINRTAMIEDLADLLLKDEIQIYNEDILQQLKWFIKHKNGKIAAAYGKHDDYVMALLIAVQMARNVVIKREREEVRKPAKWSLDWHIREENKRRILGRRV